jgi:hypothetical protein
MGADIDYLCLNFTDTEEILVVKKVVELIHDGANIDVTDGDLLEHMEACLKYCLLGRYKEFFPSKYFKFKMLKAKVLPSWVKHAPKAYV